MDNLIVGSYIPIRKANSNGSILVQIDKKIAPDKYIGTTETVFKHNGKLCNQVLVEPITTWRVTDFDPQFQTSVPI